MKLKICGLKTPEAIEAVNEAGIDYAGFVFAPSKRQIDIQTARKLKKELDPAIKAVGVFVGESYDFIKELVDEKIIDMVQFHGDVVYKMPCRTIQAFRMRSREDIRPSDCDFVLFDAFQKGANGSAGGMFDWKLIEGYQEKPFFLAGGINAANIRQAMALRPYGIDLSSGVEENGIKSKKKIREVAYECKVW